MEKFNNLDYHQTLEFFNSTFSFLKTDPLIWTSFILKTQEEYLKIPHDLYFVIDNKKKIYNSSIKDGELLTEYSDYLILYEKKYPFYYLNNIHDIIKPFISSKYLSWNYPYLTPSLSNLNFNITYGDIIDVSSVSIDKSISSTCGRGCIILALGFIKLKLLSSITYFPFAFS